MSMINTKDILETIKMIEEEHLDIRTITMGISLRDLASSDIHVLADKVYDKITRRAEKLVATGEQIERELGIPIINKRISVTPIAMIGAVTDADSYVPLARARSTALRRLPASTLSAVFPRWCRKVLPRATRSSSIPYPRRWLRPVWSARRSTWPRPRRASIWTPLR